MRQFYLLLSFFSFLTLSQAQTGCPGCVVAVPAGLAADTVYLPGLPDGEQDKTYSANISFRLPKTTTPVNKIDGVTPAGLTINKIEIVSVEGLPPGLNWQANKTSFDPATMTDGCFRICGTPEKSDSFRITVKLKATVLIISQETSFPMRIYIAPKKTVTEGFTMTNVSGCGSTTVAFKNNVPSAGKPGYTYEWDFGDGSATFKGETPPPHVYAKPGKYNVTYRAVVDTQGFILKDVTVLKVGCSDGLGLNAPDLYIRVRNPAGTTIFDSSPHIENTKLPHVFPVNLKLGTGNYALNVQDEDGGLEGGDDDCGVVSFNILSNDTLEAGELKAALKITHKVDTIRSAGVVTVYAKPVKPGVTFPNGTSTCVGGELLVLVSSYGTGNQWMVNGKAIAGATNFIYQPKENGFYQVQYKNADGCTALSDSVPVLYKPLPAEPIYLQDKNLLSLGNPAALPPGTYSYQWFEGQTPIVGAIGSKYCIAKTGSYTLRVYNPATGCFNSFTAGATFVPDAPCIVGTNDLAVATLRIFPNPATEIVQIQLEEPLESDGFVRIWDMTGRLVRTEAAAKGASALPIEVQNLASGVFLLELEAGRFRGRGRVMVGF
jgi:Secretion system C-terminal sorting domain/PKD domain